MIWDCEEFLRTTVEYERIVVQTWIDVQNNIILIVFQIHFESMWIDTYGGPAGEMLQTTCCQWKCHWYEFEFHWKVEVKFAFGTVLARKKRKGIMRDPKCSMRESLPNHSSCRLESWSTFSFELTIDVGVEKWIEKHNDKIAYKVSFQKRVAVIFICQAKHKHRLLSLSFSKALPGVLAYSRCCFHSCLRIFFLLCRYRATHPKSHTVLVRR